MQQLAQLLPPNFSQAIGWTILHSFWQAMLIAILSAIALVMMRHQKAKMRYRVIGLGLGLVLLSAVATFCWYAQGERVPVVENLGANGALFQDAQIHSNAPNSTVIAEPDQANIGFWAGLQTYFEPHLSLIALLWCLGFAFCFLRLLGSIGYVQYLKTQRNFPADEYWVALKDNLLQRAGMKRAVELVESTLVRTPLVVGHLKPYIMFPIGFINRLDPYEVEAIIAHEIAHILRRDYLFNILQSLVETIFYYHPAVWWMSATMRREREIAADELAIALTGNAVTYAKALVVVQELAYFPLSPALAFAGERKSQLFTRIQRILHTKNSKSFVMEKFVSAGLFLLIVVGLAYTQSNTYTRYTENNTHAQAQFSTADSISGIWQAEIKNNELCLIMTRGSKNNHWSNHECFPISAFSALPSGQGVFSMVREAGTITFNGIFEGNEGYGKFKFQENPDYRKMLQEFNIQDLDEDVMIHLCMNNVNRDYIRFLNQKGYRNIEGGQLAGMAIHGLDKEKINEYLAIGAKTGNKNLSLDDLMAFKIHDISEAYVKELSAMGFKSLSMDDIMAAKVHEITPEYLNDCKKMGYDNLEFENVLAFKIHGLDAAFVNGLKAAGFNKLSAEDAVACKIHNLDEAFVKGLKAAGFENISAEDAVACKIHNLDAAFVQELQKAGMVDLSMENAMAYKIHDIQPEYVASIRAAGFPNITGEEILGFMIHSVTPELITSMQKLGFKNLGADDILGLKIHGVDAAFIESYKTIFDQPLSKDDALSLKIHEVTPEFIRRAREKGFVNMRPEEYINLKIQFGDKVR